MAGRPLVIVESPAKAKTLSRFLGANYRVEASYGHVRDLPESAADVPKEIKAKSWGRMGVDVESDFTPYYVVPGSTRRSRLPALGRRSRVRRRSYSLPIPIAKGSRSAGTWRTYSSPGFRCVALCSTRLPKRPSVRR